MIYWITGKAGSGKTTYALHLSLGFESPYLILDGDKVRKVFEDEDFSNIGRWNHIGRMARIAKIAEDQGITVIIACVSPYKWMRQRARKMFKESKLIYIKGGTLWPRTHYEEPDEEEFKQGGYVYELVDDTLELDEKYVIKPDPFLSEGEFVCIDDLDKEELDG